MPRVVLTFAILTNLHSIQERRKFDRSKSCSTRPPIDIHTQIQSTTISRFCGQLGVYWRSTFLPALIILDVKYVFLRIYYVVSQLDHPAAKLQT